MKKLWLSFLNLFQVQDYYLEATEIEINEILYELFLRNDNIT